MSSKKSNIHHVRQFVWLRIVLWRTRILVAFANRIRVHHAGKRNELLKKMSQHIIDLVLKRCEFVMMNKSDCIDKEEIPDKVRVPFLGSPMFPTELFRESHGRRKSRSLDLVVVDRGHGVLN